MLVFLILFVHLFLLGCKKALPLPAVAMERGNPQRTGERFERPPEKLAKVLWRFPLEKGEPLPLLVFYDRVIVASPSRTLLFLRASGGSLITSTTLDSQVHGICALADRVIALTEKGAIYALGASGETLLKARIEHPPRGSPLCFEREVWIGTKEGFLVHFDPRTGKVRSPGRSLVPDPSPLAYAPSLDAFFFGSGDFALYRIPRNQQGTSQWIALMSAPIVAPPVIGDSSFFAVDRAGMIRAFTFSGDLLWERKIPGVPRAPILLRDRIVLGSSSGVLTSLRLSDGVPLWQREGPPITSPLTLAGGRIILCREGRVELVSSENGELLGTHPISGRRCSEPVLYPGAVILSTDEGAVVAIGE